MISRYKFFLIGLVLTFSLLWPLFAAPFFAHHDDIHVIRLYEMDKCIKDGQIPCRWVPDMGNLYGYPLFNYYAPLPYYFGELFYSLTNNLILSVKIMFATAFLGSFIFMYFLSRKFWGQLGGSVSALFYSFAPYHAVDFYVRGAMGEMWALMFFPAIFWSYTKLEEDTKISNLLLPTLFIAGLITSHNLSAMIFLPICIVWLLILYLKQKNRKFLWVSVISIILGLILSAFYLLPVIFEKNLVHVETTTVGYFSYTEHFKGLRRLFLDRNWGFGPSVRVVPGGERDNFPYQIGWIHLVGWLLALISAKVLWKKNRWFSWVIIFSSSIILLSIFMIHPRSEFVWKLIEPLKYLQFPWRFLILIIFVISFISGSIFMILQKKKLLFILMITLVTLFNFSYFKPEKFLYVNDQQLLSGQSWDKLIQRSIYDFLPIFASEPPAKLAASRYQILTGDTQVFDFKEHTNGFKFSTKTNTHSIIRISQYYFPDWKIFVDGKEAKFEYKNNSLGLMTIILGEGNHSIEGKLFDTPVRSIANLLSLVGFGTVILLFTAQSNVIRKWLMYYRKRVN